MGDWIDRGTHRLEIYSSDHDQRVILDGVKLSCVTEVEVGVTAGEVGEVILTLVPDELVVEGDFEVVKDVPDWSTIGDGGPL